MSFFSRMYNEMGNALSDAYAHVLYGDDAGKSAKLIYVVRARRVDTPPNTTTQNADSGAGAPAARHMYDPGLTFLEVNGRAYVRTVAPEGDAARAGVRPRDAVQFAAVLGPPPPGTKRDEKKDGVPRKNLEALAEDDAAAAAYALECERRGGRTHYDAMRRMFAGKTVPPSQARGKDQGDDAAADAAAMRELLDDDATDDDMTFGPQPASPSKHRRSPVKTVIIAATSCGSGAASACADDDDDFTLDSRASPSPSRGRNGSITAAPLGVSDGSNPLPPIILVFRRTRQRRSLGYGGNIGVPTFRLDDECDRATSLVRRLAPPAASEGGSSARGGGGGADAEEINDLLRSLPDPTAWDEMVHDGTEWLLGEDSVLPPDDGTLGTASWAGGANGRNTSTPQKDCNSSKDEGGSDTIPLDPLEAKSSENLDRVRRKMLAEAVRKRKALRQKAAAAQDNDGAGTVTSAGSPSATTRASGGGGGGAATGPNGGEEESNAEADTIRGMIQKAVGLAFVRTSKVVMGVSLHGGSGIVIARLPDGTWSAPSAISTFGLGLGIQFGLEVADYVFIIQTDDAMDHFRRGGSFTVGGNVGAAVAGMGREAYGAASMGACDSPAAMPSSSASRAASPLTDNDDATAASSPAAIARAGGRTTGPKKHASAIAPIVAYARSQGLYFGVSLEGSRISVRDDVNDRTYKFLTGGRSVTAADVLSGAVSAPPEAEELYATLHAVEFTHEIAGLPRPPEVLRGDAGNDWRYDRSTLSSASNARGNGAASPGGSVGGGTGGGHSSPAPFSFLSSVTDDVSAELGTFETKFKKFLYGGVSVQRLVPNAEPGSGGKTRRERRTLWLMLPEVGALRLGFVSKLNDNGDGTGTASDDQNGGQGGDDYSQYTRDDGTTPPSGLHSHDGDDSMTMDGWGYDDHNNNNNRDGNGGNNGDKGAGSARAKKWKSGARHIQPGRVRLSNKHCVALTDVTLLSQEPNVSIRFDPDDATEHLRVISIQDVAGTSLLFLANNFKEAELLVCGLKLLMERETARLGVRGGVPITQLGGTVSPGGNAMSPAAARGVAAATAAASATPDFGSYGGTLPGGRSRQPPASPMGRRSAASGYISSDNEDGGAKGDGSTIFTHDEGGSQQMSGAPDRNKVPEGRASWSQVPARDFLRASANAAGRGGGSVSSASNVSNNMMGVTRSLGAAPRANNAAGAQQVGADGRNASLMQSTGSKPFDERGSLGAAAGAGAAGALHNAQQQQQQQQQQRQAAPISQALIPAPVFDAAAITPTYVHGQLLSHDIAASVTLPLPLPLCRVLLLDSSSPVVSKWETDRGDRNYSKGPWTFPPSTPRELERHESEHRLIASGSMAGASRTTSYDRVRNGEVVRLAETQVVDADDAERLTYAVSERMPRRGFGVRVRILLASAGGGANACMATVTAELRPLGKNMANQMAVHKAFLLVLSEIRMRYGTEGIGLLAGFFNVVNNLPAPGQGGAAGQPGSHPALVPPAQQVQQPYPAQSYQQAPPAGAAPVGPAGTAGAAPSASTSQRQQSPAGFTPIGATAQGTSAAGSSRGINGAAKPSSGRGLGRRSSSRKKDKVQELDRPATPSMSAIHHKALDAEPKQQPMIDTSADFGETKEGGDGAAGEETAAPIIAVKPLPKIRLDLMPAPREEDEDKDARRKSKSRSSRLSTRRSSSKKKSTQDSGTSTSRSSGKRRSRLRS